MNDFELIIQKLLGPAMGDPSMLSQLYGDGNGVTSLGYPGQGWSPQQDVGMIIAKCTRGSQFDAEAFQQRMAAYASSLELAYGVTLASLAAQMDSKPNNAITLAGSNATLGATYAGGTPVVLFARVNGALAATPGMTLQPWMSIHRIVAEPIDASNGWKLCGGSIIVGTDPVPSFPNDVALSIIRPELDRLDSPLASLYNRRVRQMTTLQMSAIHYGSAAIPLIQGITIEFMDDKCPQGNFWSSLSPAPASIPFPTAVRGVITNVRLRGPATVSNQQPTLQIAR